MRDVILAYHSIDGLGSRLSVPPDLFERQIAGLLRRGYTGATVSELLESPAPGPQFAVTFDDGFYSVAQNAFDILAGLGVRATVFPIADGLGKAIRWVDEEGALPPLETMDAGDLRTLATAGWEVGSHGCTHRCHLEVTGEEWKEEATRSRAVLEQATKRKVRGLAYPQGCHDRAAAAALAEVGYAWACTTMPGMASGGGSPYTLRRVTVGRSTSAIRFRMATVAAVQTVRRASPLHRRIADGHHSHGPAIRSTEFA